MKEGTWVYRESPVLYTGNVGGLPRNASFTESALTPVGSYVTLIDGADMEQHHGKSESRSPVARNARPIVGLYAKRSRAWTNGERPEAKTEGATVYITRDGRGRVIAAR